MAKLPQWSTPERQRHLLSLFEKYGNQCLLGHDVCPYGSHYLTYDHTREWVSIGKRVEGWNAGGMRTGVFRTEWRTMRVIVPVPILARLYNKVAEAAIESWKAEDRERRSVEWSMEQSSILDGTYGRYGSQFDPVARDVYVNERPAYYLVGLGVNPFTFKRVALVRVPSTFVHLFVDVAGAVQEVSTNARRKARRYGKISATLQQKIDECCKAAVADWWSARQ